MSIRKCKIGHRILWDFYLSTKSPLKKYPHHTIIIWITFTISIRAIMTIVLTSIIPSLYHHVMLLHIIFILTSIFTIISAICTLYIVPIFQLIITLSSLSYNFHYLIIVISVVELWMLLLSLFLFCILWKDSLWYINSPIKHVQVVDLRFKNAANVIYHFLFVYPDNFCHLFANKIYFPIFLCRNLFCLFSYFIKIRENISTSTSKIKAIKPIYW